MWIDYNNYIYTLRGIKKSSDLKKGDLIRNSKELIRVEDLSMKKNQNGYLIIFEDNSSIFLKEDTLVKNSFDKKKKVFEIKEGEYLKHSSLNYFNSKEGSDIYWDNKIRTMAYPIQIPDQNNLLFCEWVGIFMAIGTKNKNNGSLAIDVTNRNYLIDYYVNLTKKVFNITPLIRESKDNRLFLEFYSSNLVRFLNIKTGYKFKFRKVPNFLYNSSVLEILSFIKGISIKGFLSEKKQNIIYNGNSKIIVEFIQYFLKSIGYYSKIKIKGNIYYLILTSYNKNTMFSLETINQKLDLNIIKEKYSVKTIKELKDYKISASNTNRSYINIVKKENRELMNASALRSLTENPLLFDYYFLKVKSIKKEVKNIVDIKINKDSFLEVNNLLIK